MKEVPFFLKLFGNDCFMAKRILPMLAKILTLVAHCWCKSENKKCPGIRIWAKNISPFFHEIYLTGNDTSLKPDMKTVEFLLDACFLSSENQKVLAVSWLN